MGIAEDLKLETDKFHEQREGLEYLKENYTVLSLLEAQNNHEIDVEAMFVPTSFKRLGFVKAKAYKVNDDDFYGNIIIETEQPNLISSISLMTIHKLMEMNYDRYGVIMGIKSVCEKCNSSEEVIKAIAEMIPSAEAQVHTQEG